MSLLLLLGIVTAATPHNLIFFISSFYKLCLTFFFCCLLRFRFCFYLIFAKWSILMILYLHWFCRSRIKIISIGFDFASLVRIQHKNLLKSIICQSKFFVFLLNFQDNFRNFVEFFNQYFVFVKWNEVMRFKINF